MVDFEEEEQYIEMGCKLHTAGKVTCKVTVCTFFQVQVPCIVNNHM